MRAEIGYRPDVDGLRAVAVLSVLLYHLGVPPVSGGFVGVDVFFVISGYLITGIILSQAAAGRFSFADFYTRRARRLAPALLATIAAVFILAAFLFSPEDLARTSASTAASLLGVSNIHFWKESGYFDVGSILKPLLHIWSLAVEAQFYLVWPVFLLVLNRIGRGLVLPCIVAVIFVGTAASLWIYPLDPSAAFYLTPFRMHEFALGGLVACLDERRVRSRGVMEALFIGGLIAMLAAIVGFDDTTVFPGYAVLLPTVGAALVIFAGSGSRASAILRHRAVVHVGRISYSLYLVHWPLIVFAHYTLNRPLGPALQVGLLAASLVLAELSYRYIEKPLRRPSEPGRRNAGFFAGCALLGVITLLPAAHAWQSAGWVWRFPADLQAINSIDIEEQKDYVWKNFARLGSAGFTSGKRHVLVIGDSQAADLVNVLIAAGFDRRNEIITRASLGECGLPYTPDEQGDAFWNAFTTKNPALFEACREQHAGIVDSRLISKADYIIVSYFWRDFVLDKIDDLLADFGKRTTAKVLLVGAKAFERSSIQLVNEFGRTDGLEQTAAQYVAADARDANRYIAANFADDFVDLISAVCPRAGYCHVLTPDGMPIYWDHTHFTRDGAEFIGRSAAATLFPFLN